MARFSALISLFLVANVWGEGTKCISYIQGLEDLPEDVAHLATEIASDLERPESEIDPTDVLKTLLKRDDHSFDEARAYFLECVASEYGATLEGDDLGQLVHWADSPHLAMIVRALFRNSAQCKAGWCSIEDGGMLGWILAAGEDFVCSTLLSSGINPSVVDLAVRISDYRGVLEVYGEIAAQLGPYNVQMAAALPWLSNGQQEILDAILESIWYDADQRSTFAEVASDWAWEVSTGIDALEAMAQCDSCFNEDAEMLLKAILQVPDGECEAMVIGTAALLAATAGNDEMMNAIHRYAPHVDDGLATIVTSLARAYHWDALANVLSSDEISHLPADAMFDACNERVGVIVMETILDAPEEMDDEMRVLLRIALDNGWAAATGVPLIFGAAIKELCKDTSAHERTALAWAVVRECVFNNAPLYDGMALWPDTLARVLAYRQVVHPAAAGVVLASIERGLAADDRGTCWVVAAVAGLCDAETLELLVPLRADIDRVCPGQVEEAIAMQAETCGLNDVWGVVADDSPSK